MINYRDDFNYAAQKLCGSLIRFQNQPVFVDHISGEGLVEYHFLVGTNGYGNAELKEFDLSPVPLGFVNKTGMAVYYSRLPARNYRQGLREQTIMSFNRGMRVRGSIDKHLHKTIVGDYPNLEYCVEYVFNGEKSSIAFSRTFAIFKGMQVHYKRTSVGSINHSTGEIILKDEYSWLQESLGEVL